MLPALESALLTSVEAHGVDARGAAAGLFAGAAGAAESIVLFLDFCALLLEAEGTLTGCALWADGEALRPCWSVGAELGLRGRV